MEMRFLYIRFFKEYIKLPYHDDKYILISDMYIILFSLFFTKIKSDGF